MSAAATVKQINKTAVRLEKGDITDIEVDAFVYYAQSDLAIGSGFGTAISVRGGPAVKKELDELEAVPMGEAVVSTAGKMKAEYIIHAVGPKFNEEDTEGKLRSTIESTLKRAEEKDIKRIAFPAMGSGFYGIPVDLCVRVMMEAITSHLQKKSGIEEVIICVMDSREYGPFQAALR